MSMFSESPVCVSVCYEIKIEQYTKEPVPNTQGAYLSVCHELMGAL